MNSKRKKEAGYSLLGVLISLGLVSGIALTMAKMSKQSRHMVHPIKRTSYVMDLKYYINSNFSCEETLKNVTCSAGSADINTYRKSGEVLTETAGTDFYRSKQKDDKYSFVVNATCEDAYINFYYTTDIDPEKKHLFDEIPIVCRNDSTCTAGVDTLSFEDFEHNDPIDNSQFEEDYGITFSSTAPLKVAQNGTKESVAGGDHAYECGKCGSKASGKRYNGVRNDATHEVGNFFITDDSEDTEFSLEVDYENPSSEASGIILDLDKNETWIVKAYDGDTEVYSRTYEGDGQYDGAPLFWKVDQDPAYWKADNDVQFDRIVFIGKDEKGGKGNFGLAFDNFSPSKVCEEFQLP